MPHQICSSLFKTVADAMVQRNHISIYKETQQRSASFQSLLYWFVSH